MSNYLWNSVSPFFEPSGYMPYPVSVISATYDEDRQRLRLELDFPGRNYTILLNNPQAKGLLLALRGEPENLLRSGQERELSNLFQDQTLVVLKAPSKEIRDRGLSLQFGPSGPQILEIEE
jgi:hypothetical protein